MQGNVGIHGIGIERLTQHERRLFVLVAGFCKKTDIGCQAHIAGHLLPDKLKCVSRKPHVLSAARDRVRLVCSVVLDRAGVQHGPNIVVAFKDFQWCLIWLGNGSGMDRQTTTRSVTTQE